LVDIEFKKLKDLTLDIFKYIETRNIQSLRFDNPFYWEIEDAEYFLKDNEKDILKPCSDSIGLGSIIDDMDMLETSLKSDDKALYSFIFLARIFHAVAVQHGFK
jgi:hypothetical protein